METTVLIAIGSNRRHPRHGVPADVVRAAIRTLAQAGLAVDGVSRLYHTAPLGPPQPAYVNAAVRVRTCLPPQRLLQLLKTIERAFGPKGRRRWWQRVLDLDIIGYGAHIVPGRLGWTFGHGLGVPHRRAHERAFVLRPLADVAPEWRHPIFGVTVRQLLARAGGAKTIRATEDHRQDLAVLKRVYETVHGAVAWARPARSDPDRRASRTGNAGGASGAPAEDGQTRSASEGEKADALCV